MLNVANSDQLNVKKMEWAFKNNFKFERKTNVENGY